MREILSPDEASIVAYVMKGCTNEEIRRATGCGKREIIDRVSEVKETVGADTRLRLALWGHRCVQAQYGAV